MFNPDRVELVRLRLGLTKIGFAKALEIDRSTLHRLIAGTCDFSENVVENLVRISGYPHAFFEKDTIDYPDANSVSFRSLRSLTAASRNAALAAGALAFELDDWINERYELPGHSLPPLDSHEPTDAALAIRTHWGIGERPISNMINMLESHGVRVFSLSEGTRHLDAYSFWRNERPYIFLNTIKTPERSRFDAAHELGHLVLHLHGGPTYRSAEEEANSFASTFLMPPADLRAHVPVVRSMNDLIEGKKRWRVSAAALAYTLHKQGYISEWHYRGYCIELSKIGRAHEPNGIEPETSQIWQKILTDLWQEGISLSHIASELTIPEAEISDLLFGMTAPPVSGQRMHPDLRIVE